MAPSKSTIIAHESNAGDAAEKLLYDVTVFGKTILTTYTKWPHVVTEWIEGVKSDDTATLKVGFEMELENPPSIHIGTIQFSVETLNFTRCLVFQLQENPLQAYPISLYQFLADQNNLFVSVGTLAKMRRLEQHFTFELLESVRSMELGTTAALVYKKEDLREKNQKGLASFISAELEMEWPNVDHNDWGRTSNLSHHQVHYACLHCFLNHEIAFGIAVQASINSLL